MDLAKIALVSAVASIGGVCAASAADSLMSYGATANESYTTTSFDFEGFYLSVYGGAWFPGNGPLVVGSIGGAAGANFFVTDMLLAGIEFQGGAYNNGVWAYDAFLVARGGALLTETAFAYALTGFGNVGSENRYALGLGVELGAFDPVSVRAEVVGTGSWGGGLNATRATIGLVWHFN